MARLFGLDFGTTNSLVSFIQEDREAGHPVVRSLTHLTDGRPHPSVVWFSPEGPVVGREARDQLSELGIGVFGDIVRSPKAYLGGPAPVEVGGVARSSVDVAAELFRHLRKDALSRGFPGQDFARAVVTVPVNMRGKARRDLREAASQAGVRIHQFVHEPMAALYGYLRGRSSFRSELARLEGRIVMVFDWGGGTLDLTLCKIEQGTILQVLNVGEPSAGGDQFDLRILNRVKEKHQKEHPGADWGRMQPTAEARLLKHCEDAKIRLSESEVTTVYLREILQGVGSDLDVTLTRSELRGLVDDLVGKGLGTIQRLLKRAELPIGAIDFCLVTGGMVAMPAIREGLIEILGGGTVREIENAETVISEGASWIAHDDLRVRLAKPIEVLNCHDVYVPVMGAYSELPQEGTQVRRKISLYCVDPRDGFAKLQVARPRWPGQGQSVDDRLPYACLCVDVDPNSQPLQERLELELAIDDNLIANVGLRSMLSDNYERVEIHDLEFGLGVVEGSEGGGGRSEDRGGDTVGGGAIGQQRSPGDVRIRGNLAERADDWRGVPGEIVGDYPQGHTLSRRQLEEKMYYSTCVECRRNIYQIERDGCDPCSEVGLAASVKEAQERRL